MSRKPPGLRAPLLLAVPLAVLPGCASQGPGRMPPDSFNYNKAIGQASNEQMLLNLVRLRYREIPVFLAVASVLTQYIYAGTVSVDGSYGRSLGAPLWSAGGRATYRFVERPTITYAPLTGDDFAEQLMAPIPSEMVFSLLNSGWDPDQLLIMCMYRLNDYLNVAFDARPETVARIREFRTVATKFIELARRGAIEVQRHEDGETMERYVVFDVRADPETQGLIDDLKKDLDLDPDHTAYRITERIMGRKPDELTVRVRSILELMGFLSQGIGIPPAHREQNRAAPPFHTPEDIQSLIPLHVSAQVERPEGAFVAIQYHDHWFYIPHTDHISKQAFSLLAYLYQMQAPQAPTAGPLLTVPTG